MPCCGLKKSPRTSIQCYSYIFWSFGTLGFNILFWKQSSAQPGARRHLPFISLMNRLNQPSLLFAVFPKDLFSDNLEFTIAVVVPCGGSTKSPRSSMVLWVCRVQHFFGNKSFAQPGARRDICHYLSRTDSVKPKLAVYLYSTKLLLSFSHLLLVVFFEIRRLNLRKTLQCFNPFVC